MPFINATRASLGAALALLTASFGSAADEPKRRETLDVAQAGRGQAIYLRFCSACHGPMGIGDGPLATGLRTNPTDLTRLAVNNGGVFSYDKVSRAIDGRDTIRMHGPSDMPVWGEVFSKTKGTDAPNPEEAVARITHYIWSIQKPPTR
jgi:mono/diheme cytochrome c family protein